MQDQPTRDSRLSPAEEDGQAQAVVLNHLLDDYPARLSIDELVSELTPPGDTDFWQRDVIERAARDLGCAGLLHRHDSFVWPTRAARHASLLPKG